MSTQCWLAKQLSNIIPIKVLIILAALYLFYLLIAEKSSVKVLWLVLGARLEEGVDFAEIPENKDFEV